MVSIHHPSPCQHQANWVHLTSSNRTEPFLLSTPPKNYSPPIPIYKIAFLAVLSPKFKPVFYAPTAHEKTSRSPDFLFTPPPEDQTMLSQDSPRIPPQKRLVEATAPRNPTALLSPTNTTPLPTSTLQPMFKLFNLPPLFSLPRHKETGSVSTPGSLVTMLCSLLDYNFI